MKKSQILFFLIIFSFNSFSQNCDASFMTDQDTANPAKFIFLDMSDPVGNIDTWTWNFGDGFTSSLQNPVHTYSQNGDFIVKLTIYSDSCSSSFEDQIYVGSNSSNCTADFYFDVDSTDYLKMYFWGYMEQDSSHNILWHWDFGDGTTSNLQNPTHTYLQDSAYMVTFVADNGQCVDTVMQLIPTGNYFYDDDCIAMFSYDFVDTNSTTFAFFDESWSDDTSYTILWDFGDGVSSSDFCPIHTYQQQGIYDVKLVIQSGACSDSTTITVYANNDNWYPDDCQAMFYFSQDDVNSLDFSFFDASYFVGNNNSWIWDFGDNTRAYIQNPTHQYMSEGEYTVTLTIISDSCSNSLDMNIIAFNDTTYIQDLRPMFYPEFLDSNVIKFHNISQGAYSDIIWHFGDGQLSYDHDPTHTFDEVGIHEIALSIGNGNGFNTATLNINFTQQEVMYCNYQPGGNSLISRHIASSIVIFPNPVNETLFLKNIASQNAKIYIFNSIGQLQKNISINNYEAEINVSDLSSGIYFIKILSNKKISYLTFVKR